MKRSEALAPLSRDHHVALEAARARMLDGSDVDDARALGELLTSHVRFEERVLFHVLERALDDEHLAVLGAAVDAAERSGQHP